jgi:hypothetical protein
MRVPQVTERMKEAPAQALRAVFAGIGQVLLVADRIRNRPADGAGTPSGASPEPAGTAPAGTAPAGTAEAAAKTPAPGPLEAHTTAKAPAPAKAPAAKAPAAKAPAAKTSAAKAPAAKAPAPAKAPAAKAPAAAASAPTADTAAAGLPLANYDELPFASLRARMRSLDAAQLRALADYESTHAGRAAVLAMFERRIAKLDGGQA